MTDETECNEYICMDKSEVHSEVHKSEGQCSPTALGLRVATAW